MNALAELLTPFASEMCLRVTGQTVNQWAELKANRLHEAVRTRKIEIGRLYTADQTDRITRWCGLPFDAFEAVTIRTSDAMLTGIEQTAVDAWEERTRGKTPTIEVERRGRSEPMIVLSQLNTVTRYRLVNLGDSPNPTGRKELPASDRD